MNFMNPPSEELLASLQRNSESVYSEFKHRVSKYRKIDYDSLENLAGGRVWSAEDALTNHLVDKIGYLNDAVMKAAELAKIKTYQTVVLPQKKNFMDVIMEQLKNNSFTKSNLNLDSMKDLLIKQLQGIFKPYATLCLLPVELD
jgi:protease IV